MTQALHVLIVCQGTEPVLKLCMACLCVPLCCAVSHILQIIRPDVLLLNEFDYEPQHAAVEAFQTNYLAVPQAAGLEPLQ